MSFFMMTFFAFERVGVPHFHLVPDARLGVEFLKE
jgi:hypothetical protein